MCRRQISPEGLFELTFDDWHDSTLLNGRRTLEAISINTCLFVNQLVFCASTHFCRTSKKFRLQVHRIERIGDFIVV